MSYHGRNKGAFTIQLKNDGTSEGIQVEVKENETLEIHGRMMTFAWTVCGLIMIITQRFMHHLFPYHHFVHVIVGFILLILALVAAFLALNEIAWDFSFAEKGKFHMILGSVVTFSVVIVVANGMILTISRVKIKHDWNTKKILMMRKGHRITSYITLVLSQFALASGMIWSW